MPSQIVIVWPDQALAEGLARAFGQTGARAAVRWVEEYPDVRELLQMAEAEGGAAAIVVGLTYPQTGLEILQEIRRRRPELVTVAANETVSTDLLREAMRAGAQDFLAPPFEAGDLQRVFANGLKPPKGAAEGRLVTFAPCQGTDGASTIALHVAQALASAHAKRALLVDADLYCGVTAFRLGLKSEYQLVQALERADDLDDLWKKLVVSWKGLDVLTAPEAGPPAPHELFSRLPGLLRSATRRYDYVVADLPPAFDAVCVDACLAAQEVYLVCTPEVTSLHLARRRIADLLAAGASKDSIRLVVNRVGSRSPIRPPEVAGIVGIPVAWSVNNDYDSVSAAALKGGLIERNTELGEQLYRLSCYISGREDEAAEPALKKRGSWKKLLSFS